MEVETICSRFANGRLAKLRTQAVAGYTLICQETQVRKKHIWHPFPLLILCSIEKIAGILQISPQPYV